MAFAGLFPARATGLGLIDTTAWYGPDGAEQFRARAAAAREKGMNGLVDFQMARWFSDDFRQRHPELVAHAAQLFVANDFDCYAASCALLGDVDTRRWLQTYVMPVAVIVGEEDQATPIEMARQLHASIPQSTLTILPGAKHLTPIECPDRIGSELLALLQRA